MADPKPGGEGGRVKVLIVDDSPGALAIAKARVAKEGLEVICADGGRAGLEAARREKPDLILLDIDMPDVSGFDVCKAMKRDAELRMIPIIFVTVMGSTGDKVRGLDLGAVDYITKPFDAFELRARVRAALRTKQLMDLLVEHAHIDPLTGLANRRALMARLQQEWARIQRDAGLFSVIMADMDGFKQLNDAFGHGIGDTMLQEIAQVFRDQCREADFPARYGGEEFAILVPNEAAADAATLAERCRRHIEDIRLGADEDAARTTASFGVADSGGAPSSDAVVQKADEALYRAKQAAGNCVVRANSAEPDRVDAGQPTGRCLPDSLRT